PLFASEEPIGGKNINGNVGCKAPADQYVPLINPKGKENSRTFPCFEHLTLADLLDDRDISWRYYTPGAGNIWTAPNAIAHLRFGPDWSRNVVLKPTRVLQDISENKLAAVSWVIPSGRQSDHAKENDGTGPSWVASIVNAIGKSGYWSDTTIF